MQNSCRCTSNRCVRLVASTYFHFSDCKNRNTATAAAGGLFYLIIRPIFAFLLVKIITWRQQLQLSHQQELFIEEMLSCFCFFDCKNPTYVGNSWLRDKCIIEKSRYTCFHFFICKNCNTGAAGAGVPAVFIKLVTGTYFHFSDQKNCNAV